MKKILFALLLAIPALAIADGRDILINQRNPDDTANIQRVIASPATDGLFYYNTTTLIPQWATLGNGLSITAGVLSSTVPAGATGATGATGIQGIAGAVGPAGSDATTKTYVGLTVKNATFRIYKNATVAAGVAVFHLTDDGLSTGNALYSEVFVDSVQPIVSDATASYQFAWAFSNSNKTITVTANKLTTANILTGLLGQAAANGAVVKLIVEGK